jgi:hypothetical protein
MKKIFIILIMLVFLITGCKKKENYELLLSGYAQIYYDTFVKDYINPTPDNFEVTVERLLFAKSQKNIDYDLEKLHKCTEDSKVVITFDEEGEIMGYLYDISCN